MTVASQLVSVLPVSAATALSASGACRLASGLAVHRHRLRCDQRAGAHALQAVDDDALAGRQARW